MADRVIRISVDPSGSNPQLKTLERNLNKVESASERVDKQNTVLGTSYTKLAGILAGVGFVQAGRALVDTASRMQAINSRLAQSTNDVAGAQEFLRNTARETSSVYVDLADNFSRLLPLQKGGLITMRDLQSVTIGLANASAALGVSQNDTNLALAGFTQLLGRGGARAEAQDFDQIFSNYGALLLEIEKNAGLASGGLRQLVTSTEGISGTDVVELFVGGLSNFDGAAQKVSDNIIQSTNRVRTEYQLLADQLSEPIGDAVTPVLNVAETALKSITANLDDYITVAKVAGAATAAVFGVRAGAEILSFANTQRKAVLQSIAGQVELARAQKIQGEQAALTRAQAIKGTADEALAEASLSTEIAKGNAVRASSEVTSKASAVAKAEGIALTRQEILAETQSAAAIARTSQIEAARSVARAEQGAISATTNAVRLKFAQTLEAASASEARASAVLATALQSETAAKTEASAAGTRVEIQSRRLAQAKINEGKANTLSAAALRAEGAAYAQANAARAGAITATSALSAASTSAAAATTRQTIALRVNAIATLAATAAARGLATAYALIGGGTGAALIAAFAVYKLVTAESDAEKSANVLALALKNLNDEYDNNADAAKRAADATISAEQANLVTLERRYDELAASQERLKESAFGGRQFAAQKSELSGLEKSIDETRKAIRDLIDANSELADASALVTYSDRLESALSKARKSVSGSSAAIQAALDKILPDDKKRREVEALRVELDKLFEGNTDSAKYKEASEALDSQLENLNKLTDAEQARADALDDVRDKFQGLADSYLSEREKLQSELQSGNEVIDLKVRIDPTFSEDDGESARVRLKESINEQLKDLDDRDLADRLTGSEKRRAAAQEAHDIAIAQEQSNAQALAAARATINPEGAEAQRFQQENAALEAQNQFKLISNEDFQTRRAAKLIEHLDTLSGIEQTKSQATLDQAIASGVDREFAEKAHQERLAAIANFSNVVDDLRQKLAEGLITRQEFHAAVEQAEQDHADRLAGITTGFSLGERENQVQFGNALLDLYEAQQNRKQSIATSAARSLFDQAADATGEEKEQLLIQARNAEEQAKKRFDSEKKSNLARARLAQALAVAQAWATGVTIFDKIANAALVGLQTQSAIESIQSQQFNGGASLNTSSGGSGSSTSSDLSASDQPAAASGGGQTVTNIYVANVDEIIDDEKLQAKYLQIAKNVQDTDSEILEVEGTGQRVTRVVNG